MIRIGEKIKNLRKARGLSQEVLADYLGVSFQAVSKWENGSCMPDVTLIPAIASFFGVSTDELFEFNLYEIEQKVEKICAEAFRCRDSEPAKAEEILRGGLKQFPGNDILLNNLLYTMRVPERADEVITLCKALIETTKHDDVKYDALRILAETYKETGEYPLVKSTIAEIPEIYFTKLQLDAILLEGEDMYASADRQKGLSAEILVVMLVRLAEYYDSTGEPEKVKCQIAIAKQVAEAFREDFATPYMRSAYESLPEILQSSETAKKYL